MRIGCIAIENQELFIQKDEPTKFILVKILVENTWFDNIVPLHLFFNKKEGDTIKLTFLETTFNLTCNQHIVSPHNIEDIVYLIINKDYELDELYVNKDKSYIGAIMEKEKFFKVKVVENSLSWNLFSFVNNIWLNMPVCI